jgi:hypothetical protein
MLCIQDWLGTSHYRSPHWVLVCYVILLWLLSRFYILCFFLWLWLCCFVWFQLSEVMCSFLCLLSVAILLTITHSVQPQAVAVNLHLDSQFSNSLMPCGLNLMDRYALDKSMDHKEVNQPQTIIPIRLCEGKDILWRGWHMVSVRYCEEGDNMLQHTVKKMTLSSQATHAFTSTYPFLHGLLLPFSMLPSC